MHSFHASTCFKNGFTQKHAEQSGWIKQRGFDNRDDLTYLKYDFKWVIERRAMMIIVRKRSKVDINGRPTCLKYVWQEANLWKTGPHKPRGLVMEVLKESGEGSKPRGPLMEALEGPI